MGTRAVLDASLRGAPDTLFVRSGASSARRVLSLSGRMDVVRSFRLLLAIAALALVLAAAGLAVLNGAPLTDIAPPMLLVVVISAIAGARYVQRTRALEGEAAYAALARAAEARRAERSRAERESSRRS